MEKLLQQQFTNPLINVPDHNRKNSKMNKYQWTIFIEESSSKA